MAGPAVSLISGLNQRIHDRRQTRTSMVQTGPTTPMKVSDLCDGSSCSLSVVGSLPETTYRPSALTAIN